MSQEPTPAAPKAKRRWLQYSLRTFLALMFLTSIGLSWFTVKRQQAEEQRETFQALRKVGGFAFYDYQLSLGSDWRKASCDPARKPPQPEWLRKVLGEDFFPRITFVWFDRPGLSNPNTSQAVQYDPLTATALKPLSRLPDLQVLDLSDTEVGDAGLEHLAGASQLRILLLNYTKITDAGLAHVAAASQLQNLGLGWTNITDDGLRHLESLRQLQALILMHTNVTDVGLEHLRGLIQLQFLQLEGTQVTDRGLEQLKGLAQLQTLSLKDTKVTPEGVKNIQQSLPHCKIIR